jgi:translocation and assembly module TamB
MRRRHRALLWALLAVALLPALLLASLYVAANTAAGRGLIERTTAQLTQGNVRLIGLGGHFPERLELDRLELRDPQGLWLSVDKLQLQWSPAQLLSRRARAALLQAAQVDMERLPAYPRKPKREPSSFRWPRVEIDRLDVARLELGAALAGNPVALTVQGRGYWDSLERTSFNLEARRLDAVPSVYRASAQFDDRQLQAEVDLEEDADGPLAHLAQLPQIGAVSIHLSVTGPRDAVSSQLSVHAGSLVAKATGTLNANTGAAALEISLDADAMAPRPGIAWQRLHLTGLWRGPLTAPETSAKLEASGLIVPGVQLPSLSAQLRGQAGALTLDAQGQGLVLPSRVGDMFAGAPLAAHALMHLDQAGHPADFTLEHALVSASGHWSGGVADGAGNLSANITDLKPFAAIAALQLQGRGVLRAQFRTRAGVRNLDVSSELEISGGQAPLAAMLASKSTLSAALSFDARGLAITHAEIAGSHAQGTVHGRIDGGALSLDWKATLADLTALSPRLTGTASAKGEVSGQAPHLAMSADVDGEVSVNGTSSGPLRLRVRARDLPQRPVGELQFSGTIDAAPIELEVSAQSRADGTLEARIQRGAWKSAHAQGELRWPSRVGAPQGQVEISTEHLEDLAPLLGQPLQGSFLTHVDFDGAAAGGRARVRVEAKDAGVPALLLKTLRVTGEISGLATQPALALHVATRTTVADIPVMLRAQLQGPINAIGLQLKVESEGDASTHAELSATATLDAAQRAAHISALELQYREQTARLLAPSVLSFGDGVSVDNLRLGLGSSTWQLQGRVAPTLDLRASVHDLTADLLHPWLPGVQADGSVDVDLDLHGTAAAPTGTLRVNGHGLRARSGSVRGLPPGNITLQAQLQQSVAQVELKADAGERLQLHATGQAPLNRTAPIDLKIGGVFDLLLINPILEASGQRAQGQATLDASVAGTLAAPQAQGSLEITHADLKDYPRGLHLTAIEGKLVADGDRLQLQQFVAHAAPGTVSISGSLGLGAGLPLSLRIEAHNARPLASDLITANLDMDLSVQGALRGRLDASGKLHINRADLNIPNALPPSVAVLDVRRPGEQPPPPRANLLSVDLDIAVDAPRQVFVRGRGLNAELGGSLRVGGTNDEPNISGGFDMRNGTINLAGTTLTFTSGRVSFNGSGLKKRIDPTLDFTATSLSNGVTYTLNVGGYADAPLITLSSTPEQPQDQILSRLLFGADPAQLSTLQIAQIAAALATMSGIGSGLNPLTAVQRRLGLDRLAISSNTNGAPTAAGPSAQGTNTGATIEAGRYVSSRIYVGAKQFTTGTTQAQVQVDLTKSLKIQTAVGTGGGTVQGETPQNDPGSSIGLSYQFEY